MFQELQARQQVSLCLQGKHMRRQLIFYEGKCQDYPSKYVKYNCQFVQANSAMTLQYNKVPTRSESNDRVILIDSVVDTI